jgi:hypothetical protein
MPVTINGSNTPTAGGVTYGDGSTYVNTAAGAAGGVLYSAGSSAPAFTAAGSSGQVLQSNGASAPSWITPSAGAMSLISTVTASSSASLAFTGLSGYDKYLLVLDNILPSVNGPAFNFVVGTGSTTYITAGYDFMQIVAQNGQAVSTSTGTSDFKICYPGSLGVGNAGPGMSGFVYFIGMINSNNVFANGNVNYKVYDGTRAVEIVSGYLPSNTTAKTAIRLAPTAGNITSGTLSLYGITS